MLTILFASSVVRAGPPFQTDDPEPIDYRNYEFYAFATPDGTGVETDPAGPAFEFNYGVLPNVHLHIIVPMAAIFPRMIRYTRLREPAPTNTASATSKPGSNSRFIQTGKYRPMVGTFTMFELPSGATLAGLRAWAKFGTGFPSGYRKASAHGRLTAARARRLFRRPAIGTSQYGGWLLQRDIGKKLTLGTEVFSHGKEGLATPQTRTATLLDFGGYQTIFATRDSKCSLPTDTASRGKPETYAYVGLYWTWGKKSDQDSNSEKDSARASDFGHLDGAGPMVATLR